MLGNGSRNKFGMTKLSFLPPPQAGEVCSKRKIMIVTRSPLRITLGGGGTDLPSYYRKQGGFLVSAAIDKYIYITIHDIFVEELIVKYSKLERVSKASELEHPIVREALDVAGISSAGLEISSMADIPAGTGLGSSGSFTTALLKAFHTYQKNIISAGELAEQACDIEINRLNEPVGKQDQYIAAFGGITCFQFNKDDSVDVWPLDISDETFYNLEDNLMLFFTGFTRKASNILKDQDKKTREDDGEMVKNLDYVKDLGKRSADSLQNGDLHHFAMLMHEHWEYKKKRSKSMSRDEIDKWYNVALENGALGGKLIGAGGGGFLMFYTENKRQLRHAMLEQGLREVRFRFDLQGSKVVV